MLRLDGDDRLTKMRNLRLTHPERLATDARERFAVLARSTRKTAQAFQYKEHAAHLGHYARREMAALLW